MFGAVVTGALLLAGAGGAMLGTGKAQDAIGGVGLIVLAIVIVGVLAVQL